MTRPGQATTEVLTIAEAAEEIRISRRHLHQLLAEGSGPPVVRLGRRKIIRREALHQWLVNQETTDANGL
jgi:excisionase family DNA binding protein